jgi:hypothetical protein
VNEDILMREEVELEDLKAYVQSLSTKLDHLKAIKQSKP